MTDYYMNSQMRQAKLNQQRQKIRENQSKKHIQQLKSLQNTDNESKKGSRFSLKKEEYSPLVDTSYQTYLLSSKFAYDGPQAWEQNALENLRGQDEIDIIHIAADGKEVQQNMTDSVTIFRNEYSGKGKPKELTGSCSFNYLSSHQERYRNDDTNGEIQEITGGKISKSSDNLAQMLMNNNINNNNSTKLTTLLDSVDDLDDSKSLSGPAVCPMTDDKKPPNTAESDEDNCENRGSLNGSGSTKQIEHFFDSTLEIETFVQMPAPENSIIKCRISRNKSGMDKGIYPAYSLHLERKNTKPIFLLAARRRKKSKTSNYLISCDATDMKRHGYGFIAKVRSNFVGTQFTIYDNGRNPTPKKDEDLKIPFRKELAAIVYESNVLGFKGPRRMTVIIPGMTEDKNPTDFQPKDPDDSLIERWKKRNLHNLLELHNKRPVWNDDSQSYVLNFHGRVTQASVKNFQIIHDNDADYIVMQFGRTSDHSFTMDYSYPLSAIQAFGIALSSFDGKLACE